MKLRVVVYNVHGFRGGVERVVGLLGRLAPDVLLLNESGRRSRLRRAAQALSMEVAADPRSPLRRRVKNAILVRAPWRTVEHRLHRFEGGSVLLPRGALVATIEAGERWLRVASTHLGLHPVERRRHAVELIHLLADVEGSVVLGGDLNERPDGRAASLLAGRFHDAWPSGGAGSGETFPATSPSARIDYLFVSPDVRVERTIVPDDDGARTASDHRPLLAELSLPPRG